MQRVLFIYWGRRGALSRFALDLAYAARDLPYISSTISVSRQNELFDRFVASGVELMPVDTFTTNWGALNLSRVLRLRRQLLREVADRRIDTVILLMPHVWAPLVMPHLDAMGKGYAVIVHDAVPHTGDRTSRLNPWMMRNIHHAEVVFTLSEAVRHKAAAGPIPGDKLQCLFHPDLCYGKPLQPSFPAAGKPFRLAFFGRILPYKALPVLVEAIELLRNEGLSLEFGVFGEGELGAVRDRLHALSAEVVNCWIPDTEVRGILARYSAAVLSHVQASQSGVVAAAHGLGLPVIATPVGGLAEQVLDGVTGVLAERADASSLAKAIRRLALSPGLYRQLCDNIAATRETRSMRRFVTELVARAACAKSSAR
jgi:glycosyltransferase involved in cell wall biosynthesis